MASVQELVYEAAMKGLARQEAKLDEIRTRSGILLSIVAVAASFLGAALFESGGNPGFFWFGVILFVVTLICVVLIEVPRENWHFGLDTTTWIKQIENGEYDDYAGDELYLVLAKWGSKDIDDNEAKLNSLYRTYELAVFAAANVFVVWLLGLGISA